MAKRRVDLNLSKKAEILEKYRLLPKCSQRAAAEQLNISRGCLRNILLNEAERQRETSLLEGSDRKRQRHGKDQEVEAGLWKWFRFAQSRNAPVNGPILMQKAEEISKQLGHNEFTASEGWFYRWKKRHDLSYIKLYGEASEANTKAAAEWTSGNMQELLKRYEPANIYNADETALYFRALPDSTYVDKATRKQARGTKVAKDRLTVLICCSMTGDKHRLLVIGLSRKPRCFKNVRAFPADYNASKNAWMTTKIWSEWLQTWDKSLCLQKRKIALVVDNCTAHGDVEGLKCIEIVKLPPNTTSLIQPCDMGVIRTLKAYFRHEMRARIIDAIEDGSDATVNANVVAKKVSVLDALHMLSHSWLRVASNTIRNCWRKAKFVLAPRDQDLEHEEAIPYPNGMSEELFEEWVTMEEDASVCAELTLEEEEAEIMQQIVSKNSDGDDMDDQEEDAENDKTPEEATPSSAEMRFYMHRLQIGLERRGFDKMNEFEKLNGHVRQFLRHQQPMRQLTLDVFARK